MRVLVIEDDSPIRKSIVKGLREAEYAVDEADNGKDGLLFTQTHQYDVVILDLMLPEIDGLTILKKIRDFRAETNDAKKLIHTRRGLGYILGEPK